VYIKKNTQEHKQKRLASLVGKEVVDSIEAYDGFDLAKEMLLFNLSDKAGERRHYTKGYIIFALNLRVALGSCAFEKVRRLNYLPLPARQTLDQYLRSTPTTTHPTCLDDETKLLLQKVCNSF